MITQRTFFRLYCGAFAVSSLFWWTLSHWLYPDWYPDLLGFGPLTASDYAMAKVIGTLSALPVLGLAVVARAPERNRDFFASVLALSTLMVATYVYLMAAGDFPSGEWINVALIAVNMPILARLYPWRDARSNTGARLTTGPRHAPD